MFDYIFRLETLWWILLILYVPSCVGLIVIVLLQKGKGTSFAGAFGVGPGSETVFGPRARKSMPVKLTYIMATIFMVFSMSMSLIGTRIVRGSAPEQVVDGGMTAPVPEGASFKGLEGLGLGGESAAPAAPSGDAPAPVESAPAPAAEAPAPAPEAAAPAAEAAAPAAEAATPAPEAPAPAQQ
ncbi:MAG: preprotein translocase subunit SecG [Candidatus Hydrogenedentales bacterium]|jgi:protein translocase SecG subunit